MAATRNPQILPKVLILKPSFILNQFESEFALHFNFLKAYESPLPVHLFLAGADVAGVSALLAGPFTRVTAAGVLDHLPSLRCIVTDSSGLDHIDLSECRRRGIAVACGRDVYSDDCADTAVALLIDVLRKVSAGDRFVRSQGFGSQREFPLGNRLRGKKIGIVGLGSIGSRVAQRLEAFGCSIQYYSRKRKPSVSYTFYSDIQEIAASSDVLILCCSLTDQTRHMIGKEELSALGKNGIVVNIARGPVIDEKELVRALQEGEIAGAGLDVFEEEPKVPEELFVMDNVVMSPHSAFSTRDGFRDVFELVKGNFLAFFSNKPLISPVDD